MEQHHQREHFDNEEQPFMTFKMVEQRAHELALAKTQAYSSTYNFGVSDEQFLADYVNSYNYFLKRFIEENPELLDNN